MPKKGRPDLTGRRRRRNDKLRKRAHAFKAKRAWQPVVLIERLDIRKLGVKNVSLLNTEQLEISELTELNPFANTTNLKTEMSISETDECNSFSNTTNFMTETSNFESNESSLFSKITHFKTEKSISEPDERNPFTNISNFMTEKLIPESNECTLITNNTSFKSEMPISGPDEFNQFTNTTNFITEMWISEWNKCNPFTNITNFKTEMSNSKSDERIPFTNTINFKTEMQDFHHASNPHQLPKADEDKPLSIFLKYKSELTIPNGKSAVTLNKTEFKEKELKLLAVQRKRMVEKLRSLVNEAAVAANDVTEPALDAELLATPKPDKSNTIFLRNISELT